VKCVFNSIQPRIRIVPYLRVVAYVFIIESRPALRFSDVKILLRNEVGSEESEHYEYSDEHTHSIYVKEFGVPKSNRCP